MTVIFSLKDGECLFLPIPLYTNDFKYIFRDVIQIVKTIIWRILIKSDSENGDDTSKIRKNE